ncbi:hypothetical protein ACHQM5_028889 [Ranunculus cassubicifolius]
MEDSLIVDVPENETLESYSNEKIKGENGLPFISDIVPKLQFRKDVSRARWDGELRMSEIIERKGGMWTTTGVTRGSKLYCSIEETAFLVERGALHLLDSNDRIFTMKGLYEMIADGKNGCSWESFKAFRHLKSLGYIVGRHGVPWTLKDDANLHRSACPHGIQESKSVSINELEEYDSIRNRFGNIQINELRLAFDIYLPNSKFKKSSPGSPDFVLSISRNPPSKVEIEDLERRCNGVPLKICNVEHGLVSFFSFNSIELPVLP